MSHHYLKRLRSTFADRKDHPALIFGEKSLSYSDLDQRTLNAAAALQALGIRKGDRVALYTTDKRSMLVANLAAFVAGAVALPLNPKFTAEEMRYFLSDSGARAVVTDDERRPLVEELRAGLPGLKAVLGDPESWEGSANQFRDPDPAATDPCLIIYSSGTTGWPKGIVHTQANVGSGLAALGACWRFTPEDIVVNALPLFHVHGLFFATHLTLLMGGTVRIEEKFDAVKTLSAIGSGTVFMAVPPMYTRFLAQPEFREAAKAWGNVRLFTCGSAPIRPEVLSQLEAILGRPAINRYGMSEAFVITSLPLDGPWPQGSVGLPLEGVELRVLREGGQAAAAGEVGSVQIRGPNLFKEYWKRPDETRRAFATGWFETGDLGSRDASGFLTLAGRKTDLIISNGYNVYPPVVERVINGCPGVRECAVVGIPDDRRGERVIAAVVREGESPDEDRLRTYLDERLVDYQRPVDLHFVDGLPRNTMGKVLKRELKERFLKPG